MTNPIGGLPPQFNAQSQHRPLDGGQKQGLSDLLSNYDAENLSESDAKELVAGISGLGIKPGRGLQTALAEAGIDARKLADQAGVPLQNGPGGRGGKPAEGAAGVNSAAVEVLEAVLDAMKDWEDATDEDFQLLLAAELEEAGLDPDQPILDIRF